jgi:hypothetical protein
MLDVMAMDGLHVEVHALPFAWQFDLAISRKSENLI